MRIAALIGCILGASVMVGGCAAIKTSEPSPSIGTFVKANEVEALLTYFEYIKGLSQSDLAKELDRASQAFNRNKNDMNRIQIALLLSRPNSSITDETRALSTLEPLVKGNRNQAGSLRSFAYLLNDELLERRRLDESAKTMGQKLKEEQKRSEMLEQKLEALKTLEKSLIDREPKRK